MKLIQAKRPAKAGITIPFSEMVYLKVRGKKKHWWNRPWQTFVAHALTGDAAFTKGLMFLESHDYTIDVQDAVRLAERLNNQLINGIADFTGEAITNEQSNGKKQPG
jgi:hypothetical protein